MNLLMLDKFINYLNENDVVDVDYYLSIEIHDENDNVENYLIYEFEYNNLIKKYDEIKIYHVELIVYSYKLNIKDNIILNYDIDELNKLNIDNSIIDVFDDEIIVEIDVDDIDKFINNLKE